MIRLGNRSMFRRKKAYPNNDPRIISNKIVSCNLVVFLGVGIAFFPDRQHCNASNIKIVPIETIFLAIIFICHLKLPRGR